MILSQFGFIWFGVAIRLDAPSVRMEKYAVHFVKEA
jgi:hypothetical protein